MECTRLWIVVGVVDIAMVVGMVVSRRGAKHPINSTTRLHSTSLNSHTGL
ncbi:MAG: hypothetical protein ACE5Z5_04880 [Candidatus Bathyarchaeia archaeon]